MAARRENDLALELQSPITSPSGATTRNAVAAEVLELFADPAAGALISALDDQVLADHYRRLLVRLVEIRDGVRFVGKAR